MPTLQEQIVILGVKIGALTVSLNGLKAGRVAELEHGRAIADTEFRLAAQERASSRARLDDLNSTTEHNARGGLALGADLKALTKETAEWIDELQAEANVLADRLLALDMWRRAHHHTHNEEAAAVLRLHQASERRIDALEDRVAKLEAAPEILRVPGGHGLLPDDYDSTRADGPLTPEVFIREDIPF